MKKLLAAFGAAAVVFIITAGTWWFSAALKEDADRLFRITCTQTWGGELRAATPEDAWLGDVRMVCVDGEGKIIDAR